MQTNGLQKVDGNGARVLIDAGVQPETHSLHALGPLLHTVSGERTVHLMSNVRHSVTCRMGNLAAHNMCSLDFMMLLRNEIVLVQERGIHLNSYMKSNKAQKTLFKDNAERKAHRNSEVRGVLKDTGIRQTRGSRYTCAMRTGHCNFLS